MTPSELFLAISIFDTDWPLRLTWAIIHFLWIASLLCLVSLLTTALLSRHSARLRYGIHVSVMLVMPFALVAAFCFAGTDRDGAPPQIAALEMSLPADPTATASSAVDADRESPPVGLPTPVAADNDRALVNPPSEQRVADRRAGIPGSRDAASAEHRPAARVELFAPWIAGLYGAGVLIMLARLTAGMLASHRLMRSATVLSNASIVEFIDRRARGMRIPCRIASAVSDRVVVPVVVGFLKPMILLPPAAATGLTVQQLESVICHELAHVRRFDLLFNLLQRIVEAVLFFHPAVWIVSRLVTIERENCCDDAVLAGGSEPLTYASALIRLAELCCDRERSNASAQLATLAVTGDNPSQFKRRIMRLLNRSEPGRLIVPRSLIAVIVLAPLLLTAARAVTLTTESAPPQDESPPPIVRPVAPTHWPQWGGNAHRNNVAISSHMPVQWNAEDGTNVRWSAKLGSAVHNTPVVAGGKVFIGTNNNASWLKRFPAETDLGVLLCFDEESGEFLWQYSVPKLPNYFHDWSTFGMGSAPCVEGDRLWVLNNRCELVCLDSEGFRDGENDGPLRDEERESLDEADVVWRFDFMAELGVVPRQFTTTSPTLVGDLILVGTSHGAEMTKPAAPEPPSFVAFNKNSGALVWRDSSPGANILTGQWSSPAYGVFDGVPQAIFAGGDGWVYSFDFDAIAAGESKLLWKFDANPKDAEWQVGGHGRRNDIIATPVIDDGRVYIATGQNPEHGDGDADLWCIDPTRRGDISSELVFNKADPTVPIPNRRRLACDPNVGDFRRPNQNSGVLWHYNSADLDGDGSLAFEETFHRSVASPAIANGLLVIVDVSGIVHCLDARTGKVFWTHDLLAAAFGTPLITDGKVYVSDEDGEVTIFRLSRELKVLAEVTLSRSINGSSVAADNTLYIPQQRLLIAARTDRSVSAEPLKNNTVAGWPTFRGDPQNSGSATEATEGDWQLLWQKAIAGESIEATPIATDGLVYVAGTYQGINALSLSDGELRWRWDSPEAFVASPAATSGLLLAASEKGTLFCLNASAGQEIWSTNLEAEFVAGGNFVDETLLIGDTSGRLLALDKRGVPRWTTQFGDRIQSTPAVVNDVVVVSGCDSMLHRLRLGNGAEIGATDLGSQTGSSPAILDGRVYVGTQFNGVHCIDVGTGEVVWHFEHDRPIHSSPAVTSERVIFGTDDKQIIALDTERGRPVWISQVDSRVTASPVVVGSTVFVPTSAGHLYGFSIENGKQTFEFTANEDFNGSPVFAAGRLVVAGAKGTVFCFSPKNTEVAR